MRLKENVPNGKMKIIVMTVYLIFDFYTISNEIIHLKIKNFPLACFVLSGIVLSPFFPDFFALPDNNCNPSPLLFPKIFWESFSLQVLCIPLAPYLWMEPLNGKILDKFLIEASVAGVKSISRYHFLLSIFNFSCFIC